MHGEQAGDALHHHLARVVLGLADQRDARVRIAERELVHPFGAGARLAGAAPAQNKPGGPGRAAIGAFRCKLMLVRETRKIA